MRFRIATILLGWFFAYSSVSAAQDSGQVVGRVLEPTGDVLPGVVVDLVTDSRVLTTVTDDVGEYRFEGVPPGHAELTYRLLNFSVIRRTVAVGTTGSVTAGHVMTISLD